jgi:uncharacterized protein (UPF0262 family)
MPPFDYATLEGPVDVEAFARPTPDDEHERQVAAAELVLS